MQQAVDIVILSNGPGELATWVKPVVRALRERLGQDRDQVRISIVLSPCANASGQETAVARLYPEVDRVQAPEHFYPFLFFGKTLENWDWRSHGVVLFLGGDQFYTVMIGKRLGYRTITYAEWEARWHSLIDRFGVMRAEVTKRVAPRYAHKFAVVGDLMTEVDYEEGLAAAENIVRSSLLPPPPTPLITILPGSKATKLTLGLPLSLAIADEIAAVRPDARFVIAVAPTLALPFVAQFANPDYNPLIRRFDWASAQLVTPTAATPYLKTAAGLKVDLWTDFPAYDLLTRSSFCITTVGANTAELGALAVPMLVLIPTQQLDVMRAQDGMLGVLANLPGVGASFATLINWWILRHRGLLAWPNIWAQAEIVPELIGKLQPPAVAAIALDYLAHPEKLDQMRQKLRQARGETGAATKLVQLVCEELDR